MMKPKRSLHDRNEELPADSNENDDTSYSQNTYLNKIREALSAPVYCAVTDKTLARALAKPVAE